MPVTEGFSGESYVFVFFSVFHQKDRIQKALAQPIMSTHAIFVSNNHTFSLNKCTYKTMYKLIKLFNFCVCNSSKNSKKKLFTYRQLCNKNKNGKKLAYVLIEQ